MLNLICRYFSNKAVSVNENQHQAIIDNHIKVSVQSFLDMGKSLTVTIDQTEFFGDSQAMIRAIEHYLKNNKLFRQIKTQLEAMGMIT